VEFEPVENETVRFHLVCMTIYDMSYHEKLQEFVDKKKIQYVAYGNEMTKTNRPHLQAFAYAKEAKYPSAWRKLFKPHFVAMCKGNLHQNENYCSKTGDYTEIGVKPMGNGKKRALEQVCDRLREGEALEDIATEEPATVVQYHNGFKYIERCFANKRMKAVPRDFAPTVTYIYGPSGSGKSRYVRDHEFNTFGKEVYDCPDDDLYKWKDGYLGQEAVLYDNVEKVNTCRFLKEIDRYPIQVPVKGGYVKWRPHRIYITSVLSLEEFSYSFIQRQELLRRVTEIKELKI